MAGCRTKSRRTAEMAALLVALKALGLLVLALLILLVLALAVPITIKLEYAGGQFTVRLGVLFYTRQLWPEPPPRPKRKPRRKRRRAAAKADPNPAAGKTPVPGPDTPAAAPGPNAARAEQPPPQRPSAPPAQNGTSGKKEFTAAGMPLRRILDLLPTVGTVGRRILAGLRVHAVRLYWPIQGEDAADTALRYGTFCAAWGNVTGLLQNLVRVQCDQVQPVADYLGEHAGEEHFSCKITARVFIMVAAAVYGFFRLRCLAETQTN